MYDCTHCGGCGILKTKKIKITQGLGSRSRKDWNDEAFFSPLYLGWEVFALALSWIIVVTGRSVWEMEETCWQFSLALLSGRLVSQIDAGCVTRRGCTDHRRWRWQLATSPVKRHMLDQFAGVCGALQWVIGYHPSICKTMKWEWRNIAPGPSWSKGREEVRGEGHQGPAIMWPYLRMHWSETGILSATANTSR